MELSLSDNSHLRLKLSLRRYFLSRYADSRKVLDCCQGNGVLWHRLRSEYQLEEYWGVDVKPRAGRLRVDSARILVQPGWTANVIDIDTYGSPWQHWKALLPNVTRPVTVFLTSGTVGVMIKSKYELESIGLRGMPVPDTLAWAIHDQALPYCLHRASDAGLEIIEAKYARSQNATYVGVRLEPRS